MAASSSNNNDFYATIVGPDNLEGTAFEIGIRADSIVKLYTWDSASSKAIMVGQAYAEPVPGLVHGTPKMLRFTLHGAAVDRYMVVLRNFEFPNNVDAEKKALLRAIPYPYTFASVDDIPRTLGEVVDHKASFVWDQRAMLPLDKNPVHEAGMSRTTRTSNLQDSTKRTKDDVGSLAEKVQALDTAIIEIRDDADLEEEHLKKVDESGQVFSRKAIDNAQYSSVRMRLKITQINDFVTPLRKRHEPHVNELVQAFTDPRIGFVKTEGPMTVTVLEQDVDSRVDLSNLVAKLQDRDVYTYPEGKTVTIVDGRHRREAISRITKMTGGRFDWSRDYIEVLFQYRLDLTLLSDWEVLMLSSQKNQVASLVYEASTLNDILRSIESYSIVFESAYNLPYVKAKNTLIKEDMTKTRFLGAVPDTTVMRYIRCSKSFLPHKEVKRFLFDMCTITSEKRGNQTNLSFVTEPILLQADPHDMLLMLRCADAFYKCRKGDRFYAKEFYQMCLYAIEQLKIAFQEVTVTDSDLDVPPTKPKTFQSFLATPVRHSSSTSVPPLVTLQNALQTFKFNPGDNGKAASAQMKRSFTVLRSKILSHYGVLKKKNPVVPGSDNTESRKRRSGAIDLTKSPEPKLKKPRRTRRSTVDPRSYLYTSDDDSEKNKKKGGSSKNKKDKRKSISNNPPTPLQPHKDPEVQQDGKFDDSLDLDTVPSGYENACKLLKEYDVDGSLTVEEILMMRRFPYARSKDEEKNISEERSITVSDLSSKTLTRRIVDPSLYLRAICIPKDHRAHIFVTYSTIVLLRNLACTWAVYKEGFKDGGVYSSSQLANASVKERWEQTMADMTRDLSTFHSTMLGTSFFDQRKMEVDNNGYTILHGMADPLGMIPHVNRNEVGVASAEDVPTMTNGEWFLAIEKLFPGENALRDPSRRTEWNPIHNTGNHAHDTRKNDVGAARYQSTNNFVTNVLETANNVELAHKRAHMDVWIGILASFLSLDGITPVSDIATVEKLFLPATGGRLLLTGRLAEAQQGHNDFALRHIDELCGYFVILTGTEDANIYLVEHSHKYIFLPEDAKKAILNNLAMTKVTIPANSIFFGHGYLHHAGSEYDASGALRYHAYLRPETVDLEDAIHFNHGGASAAIREGGVGVRRVTRSNVLQQRGEETAQSEGQQSGRPPAEMDDDDDDYDDGNDGDAYMDVDSTSDLNPGAVSEV